MIVVDAPALVDFLLGRAAALDAFDRELTGRPNEALRAPELIETEALDALRRLAARGDISMTGRATRSPTSRRYGSSSIRIRRCGRAFGTFALS